MFTDYSAMSVLRAASGLIAGRQVQPSNQPHGNHETQALAHSKSGIERTNYVCWLTIFLFITVLRRSLYPGIDLVTFVSSWSVLELICWYYVFRLLPRHKTEPKINLLEVLIVFSYLTILIIAYDPKEYLFGLPLFAYMGLRFGWNKNFKASVICLLLAASIPFFSVGPFVLLHEKMARLDAIIVAYFLGLAGYSVSLAQTILIAPGGGHGIDIWKGCASTANLGLVAASFLIIVMGRRGQLCLMDVGWLLVLVLCLFGINWLRLSAMALTRGGYEYWHEGNGESIVSLADTLLVLLISSAAIWANQRKNAPV